MILYYQAPAIPQGLICYGPLNRPTLKKNKHKKAQKGQNIIAGGEAPGLDKKQNTSPERAQYLLPTQKINFASSAPPHLCGYPTFTQHNSKQPPRLSASAVNLHLHSTTQNNLRASPPLRLTYIYTTQPKTTSAPLCLCG